MGGNNADVVQNLNDIGVTGGSETHTLTVEEMPSHTHNGLYPSGTSCSGGSYIGGYGGSVNCSVSAIQPTGGDQPHNNMQPYISINYIIKL